MGRAPTAAVVCCRDLMESSSLRPSLGDTVCRVSTELISSEEPNGEDMANGSSQQKSLYVNRDIVMSGTLKKMNNKLKKGRFKII